MLGNIALLYKPSTIRGKASRLYVEQQAVVRADADSPSVILERLNGLLSRDRVATQD
jgi:hypothetical protein